MASFVSSRELEAAKQQRKRQKREMREEILREAKEKFEKDKERQELKRQTGEDKWMAPGVSERLGFAGDGDSSSDGKKRKKRRKEHKKHKKRKTSKHEKCRSDDESSLASGSESDEMWVEKPGGEEARLNVTDSVTSEVKVHPEDSNANTGLDASIPPRRDDWMMMPLAPSILSMAILSGRRETKEEKLEDKKVMALPSP